MDFIESWNEIAQNGFKLKGNELTCISNLYHFSPPHEDIKKQILILYIAATPTLNTRKMRPRFIKPRLQIHEEERFLKIIGNVFVKTKGKNRGRRGIDTFIHRFIFIDDVRKILEIYKIPEQVSFYFPLDCV